MSKKRTKILKVWFSVPGMISMIMFGTGFVLLLLALIIAYRSYGQGGNVLALMAIFSMILYAIGLGISIHDLTGRPRDDSKPVLSKAAAGCNILGIIFIIVIYVIGIVF